MRLQYIFEKDCRPVDYGELLYSRAERCFSPPLPAPAPARQAAVFVESYLRRAK